MKKLYGSACLKKLFWRDSRILRDVVLLIVFHFFSVAAFATNDNYASALNVNSLINSTCGSGTGYTTTGMTADLNKGALWGNGPNYNVWFTFQAPSSGNITVKVKTGGTYGTMQYPFIALWNSDGTTAVTNGTASAAWSAQYDTLEVSSYGLTPSAWYYISVDNNVGAGYKGSFTLCLFDHAYNYYQGAIDVSSLMNSCSADENYSTFNGNADGPSKPSCWNSNSPANYNRWFKFTATTTYVKVQVVTAGASPSAGTMQYAQLALWDITVPTVSVCATYGPQYGTTEVTTNSLTIGQTYYIAVDNATGTSYRGSFKLCVYNVADYDYFGGATDVTNIINSCSADAAYTTVGATSDQTKPSCWPAQNYNRWFKFTATSTGFMDIKVITGGTAGTMSYCNVALFNSTLTTQLACATYGPATGTTEISYNALTSGSTYYIEVDNATGVGYRGTFKLCLSDGDFNYYQYPAVLTDLNNWCSAGAAYTTANATNDAPAKPTCFGNNPVNDVWFKFQAISTSATITIKTDGSSAVGTMSYPMLALWDINPPATPTLQPKGCTSWVGAHTDVTIVSNTLTIGNWYLISVDNATGYKGSFKLCVNNISATPYYSRIDGDWNTALTWSNVTYGGTAATVPPTISDVVNIGGNNITVSSTANCGALNIPVQTSTTSLTVDNATLNVKGKLSMSSAVNFDGTVTVKNNGVLNVTDNADFTRTAGANLFKVTLGAAADNGFMTVGNDMQWIISGGTVITNDFTLNNASTLTISRDINFNYSSAGMKTNLISNNTSTVTVVRDVSFTTGATSGKEEIALNNSSIFRIGRNFTQNSSGYGKFTSASTATLEFFSGNNNSNFFLGTNTSPEAFTLGNMTVNNSFTTSPTVTLNAATTLSTGTLTLTNGKLITTSANLLTIGSSGSAASGSSSSFVDGPIKKIGNTDFTFPTGNGSTRGQINVSSISGAATDAFTAQYFHTSYTSTVVASPPINPLDHVSKIEYWNLSQSVGTPTAKVQLLWDNSGNSGITDCSTNDMKIAHYNSGSAGWEVNNVAVTYTGSCTGSGAGSVQTNAAVTSFSPFAFASASGGGINPLPVEWLYFTASPQSPSVKLEWATASEFNNNYFTLERSADAINFDSLFMMPGAGTSNLQHEYSKYDNEPLSGKSYYRVKQTDFNGSFTYSNIAGVNLEGIELITIYPNPSSTTIGYLVGAQTSGSITIFIVDMFGRRILHQSKDIAAGVSAGTVDVSLFSSGLYLLRVETTDGVSVSQKQFLVR